MNGNFCRNCGKALEPGVKFCPGCGQSTEAPLNNNAPQQPAPQQGFYMPPQPKERQLNTGLLVFSIITIVFGSCSLIALILGILALVNVIQAKSASTDEEEAQKLKSAKKYNIIGIIISAVVIVLYIIINVIIGIALAASELAASEMTEAILPFILR